MPHISGRAGSAQFAGTHIAATASAPAKIAHPLEFADAVRQALRALARTWHNRRAVRRLARLDDRLLLDIGLSRGDVDAALAEPAWHDPSRRLAENVAARRQAARARRAGLGGFREQMKWLG